MADVLEQFLECSWRGISFPTQSVDTEITHDLAVHKKADRDGGNVEATGRNPTVYSVKAIFLNTIVPGPMETWSNLFPDTYNLFIEAVEDRSTGDFVHPFHGLRRCKVVKMSESFAAQSRGGPTVTVQFMETDEGGDAIPLGVTSNVPLLKAAALDLDTYLTQLNPSPSTGLDELGFDSFSDFADSLSSAVGSVELFQNKIASKINGVVNSVNKIGNTIDKAATLTTTNPITQAVENTQQLGAGIVKIIDASNRLTAALLGIQNNPFPITKVIKFYVVPKDTTLTSIARRTRNSISDLVKLNSGILKNLIIPQDSVVKYYQK